MGFASSLLKDKMREIIPQRQAEARAFLKEHGKTKVGDITVGQVAGGMRGLPGMLYETSKLHPTEGIKYRGIDLFKIREKAPSAFDGVQPLPEAVLWLLMTGEFPNEKEMAEFRDDMFRRGELTEEQEELIKSFPKNMHPMTQFSAGVLACQPGSKFVKAYQSGIHKSKYWEPTFEDALDLCAKVSRIAAIIYHNCYGDNRWIAQRESRLDYAANYANMLGSVNPGFWELMRLYIVLHA